MRDKFLRTPENLSTITGSEATGESPTSEKACAKPPLNYDEFIASQGLDEWPQRITSEELLSLSEEAESFGTQDEMIKLFREAAPIDMSALDKIGDNLSSFETTLMYYAEKVLNLHGTTFSNQKSRVEQDASALTNRTAADSQISIAQTARKSTTKTDSISEMKRRAVEHCTFPGFLVTELTELPGSLEGPQILHRVMKAIDVNVGFKRFWKKIFLSEASVAVFQDAFWWLFIELFDKENREHDRSRLFDRIADSYTALFHSINPEVKDKFFKIYPETLSQALYSAFFEAFPESRKYFGEYFKQRVVNTAYEWVTGGHPMPGSYHQWNVDILECTNLPVAASTTDKTVIKSVAETVMAAVVAMNDPRDVKLDMESFNKMVRQMNTATVPTVNLAVPPENRSPSSHRESRSSASISLPPIPRETVQKERKQAIQSHPMGPGPNFDRVLFNLSDQSPLIRHYLRMHGKEESSQDAAKHLTRTEVAKLPPRGRPTYQEFIDDKKNLSRLMKDEYSRISQETADELAAINRRKRDINRQIKRLQNELDGVHNTLELKIISDKIMDRIDQKLPTNNIGFKLNTDDSADLSGDVLLKDR